MGHKSVTQDKSACQSGEWVHLSVLSGERNEPSKFQDEGLFPSFARLATRYKVEKDRGQTKSGRNEGFSSITYCVVRYCAEMANGQSEPQHFYLLHCKFYNVRPSVES